ncbi:MAG: hypothetical protein CMJ31_12195, partial [Phycisphaerae bacterium]|nr:hypothetical protein [Phycisphaerae bacterium]
MNRIAITLAAAAGLAASAQGQVFDWATAASGAWTDGMNWTPMGVPNGPAVTATLGLSGAYGVTALGSLQVGALNVSNPDATLEIAPGSLFQVNGDVMNAGVLSVNPGGTASNTTVRFTADGGFMGTGSLRLGAISSRAQLARVSAAITVTNGATHTIGGFGQISAGIVNNGDVVADV